MLYWLNRWMKQLLKREFELRLKMGLRFGFFEDKYFKPFLSVDVLGS